MAHLRLYQIYDTIAMQVTGVIMAANRDEVVIRHFTELLANTDSTPGKYPEDFSLLVIGEQNQDTGELKPTDPQIIYTGRVWLRLQQLKVDSSSPANTNGAGEQPPTLLNKEPTYQQRNTEDRFTRENA